MTIIHVVGARPNFPKAAPVMSALAELGFHQMLIHTGQHYDKQMSEVFLEQLGLGAPDINLGVGSGSHALQTAAVMTGLEPIFARLAPALVVVYGDVNSTLAAALVAAKLNLSVAHVEAGLRSFDLTMPEEINRLVVDRLSNLLFATSADAVAHLGNEGRPSTAIHLVGNPMVDALMSNLEKFDVDKAREEHAVREHYGLVTLHRPSNVDEERTARKLVEALHGVAEKIALVLPLHPRGRIALERVGLSSHPNVQVLEPLGYVEFLSLVRGAQFVATDSGGVQEESTMLGVPCLTLRANTERPITITHGTNRLVTASNLGSTVDEVMRLGRPRVWQTPPLWDGEAGRRIAQIIMSHLSDRDEA